MLLAGARPAPTDARPTSGPLAHGRSLVHAEGPERGARKRRLVVCGCQHVGRSFCCAAAHTLRKLQATLRTCP